MQHQSAQLTATGDLLLVLSLCSWGSLPGEGGIEVKSLPTVANTSANSYRRPAACAEFVQPWITTW